MTRNNSTLKNILVITLTVLMTLTMGVKGIYADEFEEVPGNSEAYINEEVKAPEMPDIEGLSVEEANALIEEYNAQIDEYNAQIEELYKIEVEEIEAHNAAEDRKVQEAAKANEAYEKSQERIASHANKGITANKTDEFEDLPADYAVTTDDKNDLVTIRVEEAEEKSGKTVKAMNIHIFFDEEMETDYFCPGDLEQLSMNKNITDHIARAEWECIEVDQNDSVTLISEAKPMGYSSAAFYKWMDGYTNGYWMPYLSTFSQTAVNCEYGWLAGASYTASYDEGTTDRRTPVDIFGLYLYSFIRLGKEAEEVTYTPDYKETPNAPEMLEKMDLLEEIAPEVTPVVPEIENEEIIPVIPETPERPVRPEIKETAEEEMIEEPVIEVEEDVVPLSFIEISEAAVPQAEVKTWALYNLIAAIITALTGIFMAISFFRNRDEENEEEAENEDEDSSNNKAKFLGMIPAVLAIVLFILTEDMRNIMVLKDRYTVLMVIIALAELFLSYLTRNRKDDEEDNKRNDRLQIASL